MLNDFCVGIDFYWVLWPKIQETARWNHATQTRTCQDERAQSREKVEYCHGGAVTCGTVVLPGHGHMARSCHVLFSWARWWRLGFVTTCSFSWRLGFVFKGKTLVFYAL